MTEYEVYTYDARTLREARILAIRVDREVAAEIVRNFNKNLKTLSEIADYRLSLKTDY